MIRNRELVSRAKVYAREHREEAVNALIDQYEVACELSVGPDASRSKVWEQHAVHRRKALCNAIGCEQ